MTLEYFLSGYFIAFFITFISCLLIKGIISIFDKYI